MTWRTWQQAMRDALYGEGGFYATGPEVSRHFRTSVMVGAVFVDAVRVLADRVDAALGRPDPFDLVDVGAADGALLTGVALTGPPARWRLRGVEVGDRMPGRLHGLVVANEWLDNVPVDVACRADDGLHLVEVDDDGGERLGPAPDAAALDWLRRWWCPAGFGDRAEVGSTRDAAWRAVTSRLSRGVAVAVDYRADPTRHHAGTLTGYRDGRQVRPVPDGSCDITAHVLLESCAAVTPDDAVALLPQRAALPLLGISPSLPDPSEPSASYLPGLARTSDAAELRDPDGLGAFGWLVMSRGVEPPLAAHLP